MLTQLSKLKTRLGIADSAQDELLTTAIEAMSARFERECGRTFGRSESIAQEFPGDQVEVCAASYPLENITRFELQNRDTGAWDAQTASWLVRGGCVISLDAPIGTSRDLARVVYTGGYVLPGEIVGPGQMPLPKDLEQAAVEQIAAWFYNREKVGTIRHWPEVGTYVILAQDPLLPGVAAVLQKYRRFVI